MRCAISADPCGISALYAALMLLARDAILHEKPTRLSKALAFLVRDYEPAYLYWELVEAWKKLFLVGFAVLIEPGSIEQLVIAFLVALVYMLLVGVAMPFKRNEDDYFAKACAFSLAAVFFFCVVLKVGLLTEAVDGVLSAQLRGRFAFDAGLVSLGTVASIGGALVLAAAMAAQDMLALSRLPTIRLEATHAQPALELRPTDKWHLFLSHSAPRARAREVSNRSSAAHRSPSHSPSLPLRQSGARGRTSAPPSSGSFACCCPASPSSSTSTTWRT